ncbi:MAG: DUF4129 domain-containing protein [Euzebyales bacterium]|nr:DUF4129 domain-containing protein [Euzebyales bacterium]
MTVDPSEARRVVDEVLSAAEYDPLRPGLLERILDAFRDTVGGVLDGLSGTGAGTVVGYVLLAAIVGAAVLLAVRFARGTRRDPGVDPAVGASVGRPATAWGAEAEAHEAAGRWRDAVRCRYRALIADLAASGVLEEIPGRTAGEYLAEVAGTLGDATAATDATDAFEAVTRAFEAAWYGDSAVAAGDAATMRERVEGARAAVRRATLVGAR